MPARTLTVITEVNHRCGRPLTDDRRRRPPTPTAEPDADEGTALYSIMRVSSAVVVSLAFTLASLAMHCSIMLLSTIEPRHRRLYLRERATTRAEEAWPLAALVALCARLALVVALVLCAIRRRFLF